MANLTIIAGEINAHIVASEEGAKSAIEHAWQAGRLLIAAKKEVPHGEWMPWCTKNVKTSDRQLRKYIQLAEGYPKLALQGQFGSIGSIDEALAALPKRLRAASPANNALNAAQQPIPAPAQGTGPAASTSKASTGQFKSKYLSLPLLEAA